MRRIILVIIVVAIILGAALLWPVGAEEVNEPTENTIAWAKFDAYFSATGPSDYRTVGSEAFALEELKISRGEYAERDAPTQSLWRTMSLHWGNYDWSITFRLTGPETDLKDTVEFNHDLPEGKTTTLSEGSGIFHLTRPGTYEVSAELRVLRYGSQELTVGTLATGRATFEIPTDWS